MFLFLLEQYVGEWTQVAMGASSCYPYRHTGGQETGPIGYIYLLIVCSGLRVPVGVYQWAETIVAKVDTSTSISCGSQCK